MKLERVIISGGGTGGHIFPAIAIANRIKKEYPDAKILFIGAEGKMEMEKVPEAGYEIEGLWISGFQRRLTLKNLALPFKILASLWKARGIVKKFKPQVAIGVGGYASGPTLKVASMMNVPTILQEQNSFPGKTNKLLAQKATKICVAYEKLERFFPKEKIEMTGNPVRDKVVQIDGLKSKGLSHFGLEEGKKTLLVVGGSLGAKTLNDSLKKDLKQLQEKNIQVIWQCGKYQSEELMEWSKGQDMSGVSLNIFIKEMELAYAAADVIVSRAGAIALSELAIIGKPIILVPSPNVAEDHQTKNALALVEQDAAILVKDVEAREKLIPQVLELMQNENRQNEMSENLREKAIGNADERIVNVIKSIVN
jgi:UDP-N-acetylglucosamine--N-acetylmuramyl-(pentapeptide) pyrophosphoryl-undecaprenol N-acetylglucosamine transferase